MDTLISKRDFAKIYHQENAQFNETEKFDDFNRGENNNYYQIGNSYLQFDIELKKDGSNFENDVTDVIKLVKYDFAQIFKEDHILTTGGTEKGIKNLFPKFQLLCAC